MPVLSINKQVRHDYDLIESFEAGLVLTGQEVKAVRSGQANLKSSYISTRKTKKLLPEFYLINASIAPYKYASQLKDYEQKRDRKILLNKKEAKRLVGKLHEKGLTLVPIKIYTKTGLLKIEIALSKGKKSYNKREDIKRRDIDRELMRTLKNR
ncbi:MAG: SsrA-binding protein SmpB [bacterium]